MPHRHHVLGRNQLGGAKQRGVALIFTSFILLGLVAAVGLTIEIGRLYSAQAKLDSVAQLAAIDSARVIGACAASEPADPQMAADDAATAAVLHNYGENNPLSVPVVQLGQQGLAKGLATFQPGDKFDADSTVVTLHRPAPTLLFSMFTSGRQMTSIAGAVSRPQAGISVGSKLVDIGGLDGMNGVLSALLGGPVDIGVVGYEGLADATVSIADLINAQVGVATAEKLLSMNLRLPEALNLLADAANNAVGGGNSTVAALLDTLASVADLGRSVSLGDILNIESGAKSAVSSLPINVAGLLSGLAQAANIGSPVHLPIGIDLGGLAKVSGTINVIQPPKIAFGRAGLDGNNQPRTVAHTAQVAIQLNIQVLGALPSALGGALIKLPLFIKVASAEATLDDIICAGPSKPAAFTPPQFEHTVLVGSGTSLADIGIGKFQDINALDPQPAANSGVTLVNALGIAQIRTKNAISVPLGNGSGANSMTFDGPFPPQPDAEIQTQRADTDVAVALSNGLGQLSATLPSSVTLKILGLDPLGVLSFLLRGVTATVVSLLDPVLNILGPALLTPIFNLLGLNVGTADVSVQSVVVNQPRLFCTGKSCQVTP